jgi:type IV secretory pathway VirB10-like protein
MTRSNSLVAVAALLALAGCQRAPEQAAAQPSPNPPPASQTTLAPAPAATAAPGYELAPTPAPVTGAAAQPAEKPAARSTARPSSRTRTAESTRRAPARETTSRRSDRVDHVDRAPAAEPIDIPTDDRRARDEGRGRTSNEPVMAGEPNRDRLVIPAGTELQLVLEQGLSSDGSRAGEPVTARVARATGPDGNVLLPGGTVLKGHVYRAERAGRVSGKARLSVDFDRIVVRGVEHRLDTTAIDVEGPDSHGRDAAIVGGSTVGGAIIGGILGGGNGAKKGAIVGVLGGTGAVLATRGKEVEIPSGSRWTVRVKDRVATN